jgi:hypothetical protein
MAALQRSGLLVETQAAHLLLRAVADEAVFLEEWDDIARKVGFGLGGRGKAAVRGNQEGNAG